MHLILFGILLGMGAAIPIGPVNLEIIRRNLRFGTPFGIVTGLGAVSADLTYLILLCLGALTLLQFPEVLRCLGFVGSMVLAWFGIQTFRTQTKDIPEQNKLPSLWRYSLEGYVITLLNPFTILFWVSVSSQISLLALNSANAIYLAGLGVMIGTSGWVLGLNTLLHFTRHKLSKNAIKWFNYTGGFILLIFAGMGLLRAFGLLSMA